MSKQSILTLLALAAVAYGAPSTGPNLPTDTTTGGAWQLVWSDEFDAQNDTLANSTWWTYETGGTGWGNSEVGFCKSFCASSRFYGASDNE